jgi:hypothetical protein
MYQLDIMIVADLLHVSVRYYDCSRFTTCISFNLKKKNIFFKVIKTKMIT